MSDPNKNMPIAGSVLDVVEIFLDLADVLERPDESYVTADGYSETVKLKQLDGELETMIQRSSIDEWGNGIAIFQELYVSLTNPSTEADSDVVINQYRVFNDGDVLQYTKGPVGVVGPEGWHTRQLTSEEVDSLLDNLANSHLVPAVLVDF